MYILYATQIIHRKYHNNEHPKIVITLLRRGLRKCSQMITSICLAIIKKRFDEENLKANPIMTALTPISIQDISCRKFLAVFWA